MKTKKEKAMRISKIILKGILLTGGIAIAATSPYFVPRIMPRIIRYAKYKLKKGRNNKDLYNAFYYLRSKGFIKIENRRGQIFISLTKEGKKKAGRYQIDELKIKKPKIWDRKWRILIFDIPSKEKIKREALRGKIKELGLFQLQKSVWVCPYDFQNEIELLRSFFSLTKKEMKVIMALEIEEDREVRTFFRI